MAAYEYCRVLDAHEEFRVDQRGFVVAHGKALHSAMEFIADVNALFGQNVTQLRVVDHSKTDYLKPLSDQYRLTLEDGVQCHNHWPLARIFEQILTVEQLNLGLAVSRVELKVNCRLLACQQSCSEQTSDPSLRVGTLCFLRPTHSNNFKFAVDFPNE